MYMSKIEQEIYEFVLNYTMEHLYPPSMQEICEGVGRCKSTVRRHLVELEQKNLIKLPEYEISRAIHLVGFKLVPKE